MSLLDKNRKDLYESLIAQGYFIDDDGNAELSLDEFAERMSDEETAQTFYENLIDAEFFGDSKMTEEEFLRSVCRYHAPQEKYPLTENQRGVYIDWDMNRDALQYNIPSVQRFDGLDAKRLCEAVEAAISSHPYLKTRLTISDGDVYQQPHADEPTQVSMVTLDSTPQPGFFQSKVCPFDLFNDVLYRATVYEVKGTQTVYLFLDFHHIVFDGISATVLMADIRKAYNGEQLTVETYTAFDYALDEADLLASDRYKEAQEYYDRLLAGADATVYPHSQEGNADKERNCLTYTLNMDRKAIHAYCQKHGVTENNYMMTALLETLHRITREEQVVMTTVSNGRSTTDMQDIMGMFVKTIPVIYQQAGNGKLLFSEAVMQQQQQNIEIQERDFYPFTHMSERNGLRAEVMYDYAEGMGSYGSVDDPVCKVELDTVKCPVSLTVFAKSAEQYMIYVEYDAAFYCQNDMRILLEGMKNIALQAAQNDARLSELSMLDAAGEAAVAEMSHGKSMDYEQTATFVSLFMQQVAKTPTAPAVVDEQGTFTYAELNRYTGALGQELVRLGVQPNNFVSIMLGYQKEFLVAAIGVEKSGGAYVPLDYDYPNDRLLYMLEDSESQVLITSHAIFDEKNAEGEFTAKNILFIDDFMASLPADSSAKESDIDNFNLATPNGLAYMIYTSGSTGKPKGVMIPHRAKANFVTFIAREWRHTAKSRICCHSSFSFDASIEDLYPVLTVGGTLYTVPQDARKDLSLLHDFILANGITGGCYTTQLGQMLLQQYPDLPVDYLVVGGEKMTAAPNCKCRLINTYGPTEFTVDSTFYDVAPGKTYKNIPIGRPLHNLSAYVVDPYGHLLPQGVAGELCMAGIQMAAGYWKREDLTEQVFSDIIENGKKEKVYHTGDLVRYNTEGDIEYLGRIDNQVKLRGFRIELGEIETLIGKYPGVLMESVQVKEVAGVQHLCAYYTADKQIDADELKAFLAESLTDYMVPTAYMQLDEMPLTPNGKVNTKALPQPEVKAEEIVAPATETEQVIFDIAVKLLKHDQFGVTSNLISMGLTSLTAMRLSASILQETGMSILTKDILRTPTIRELALLGNGAETAVKLTAHEKREYYPITENQRVVYLDWEMNRDTTQYNIPVAWRMKADNTASLEQAMKAVVNAHPYLKTRLEQRDGDIVQVRRDDANVNISVTQSATMPDVKMLQQRVRPFNLLDDDLYRIEIYQHKDTVSVLVDIHHIINDGLSVQVFMADLERAIAGEQLEPERYTYFDHAIDEQTLAASDKYQEAEKWFDQMLEGTEVTVWPHSANSLTNEALGIAYVDIDAAGIDEFCKQHGFTQGNYFLTMFLHLLHNVTREERVMITSINNGRGDATLLDVMGMFVKTVPVAASWTADSGKRTVRQAVEEVQQQFQQTQAFDFYPFTRMVERHKVRAEIMYEYQVGVEGSDDNASMEMLDLMLDTAKMPLMVSVNPAEKAGQYRLVARYNPALYNSHDMDVMLNMLKTICTEGLKAESMASIPLLSNTDSKAVIDYSAGPFLDVDIEKTFAKAFVACATANPECTAVNDINGDHTYRQLNETSDFLAHILLDAGVKKNDFVALLLERSWLFPLSIIATHKAGAAYTPLDIDYPVDRLQYMLENSEARVLLTTHAELDRKCMEEGLRVDEKSVKVLFLDDILTDEKAIKAAEPIDLSTPEGLAYMIYTSGSTGKPKGVVLHQAGLWNFIESIKSIYHHSADDRIASHRAFSFVAHVEDTYAILTVGGSLHIMPSDIRKDLQQVYQFIVDHKCTGCGFTTSLAMMMIDNFKLPTRYITAGGEKLTGVVSTGHPQIINVYGPTECTDHTSVYPLETGREYKNIPVGKTLPNNWMFVVSSDGQLLPNGVAGELCFAGIQVGTGYWQLPEKTAEVFCDCPFVSEDHWGRKVRMYHTGDLVRWTDEGVLEYLGRIDNQVKVRGYRVELAEIESVVRDMPDIYIAAAKVIDLDGNKYISLYYTPEEGKTVSTAAVREFVEQSSLADYMRPDYYTQLEQMPRLPNGKVNRKALPMPEMKEEEIVAPSTPMEQKLFDMTARVLKHSHFGVTTNLIGAGMTSLIAMRLSALLYNEAGLRIATKEILTKPTLKQLAAIAENVDAASVATTELRDYYPLTENQRGVYIDWEMNRNSTQYNMPKLQTFEGITTETLREALVQTVEAHPYLKTRLAMKDGDVVQLRLDNDPVEVTVTALTEEPSMEFFQEKVHPFDLFNDRLYRLDIYTYNNKVYLLRDFHHIVFDGASGFVFANDMATVMKGGKLAKESYSAFDFALDEQQRLQSAQYQDAQAYFDQLLSEVETTSYPHTPAAEMPKEKTPNTELNITVEGTAINAFCRDNDLTASNYFLTMFLQVLHRTTREDNVLITTVNNGRSDSRMMDSVGMYVKTLPVVSQKPVDGKCSAADCVRAIQQQFQQTQALDFYPYTTMTERNGIRSEIMFVFLGGLDASMEESAYKDSINLENDTAKMPLAIRTYQKDGGNYGIALEFDAAYYSEQDMHRLLRALKHFSETVAETAATDIRKVSLVDDFSATDILAISRGKDVAYNVNETFIDLFLHFAASQPDHLAVADKDSSLTYGQLDQQSNALAHKLIKEGVKKRSFVGIMLPRCKEFLLSVIAVQRAGGAYVPMDNEYPIDRLLYMLEDSEAPVLITTHEVFEEKKKEGEFNVKHALFIEDFLKEVSDKTADYTDALNLASPDGLAYMIYTSGSTGKPKGVMLPHRGLRALTAWHVSELHHNPDSRHAAHPSFSFDASLDDLICPIAGGGSVHILSEEIRKDMDAMVDFFKQNNITGLSMSSPLGMTMMNSYPDIPLEFIMMGGDKMLPLAKTKTRIINGYGPTEFSVCSSFHIVDQDKDQDIPIGRPVPNSYSLICDPEGNLLPEGVPGELCLAGIQMAEGYWHREDLTAKAFKESPFAELLTAFSNGYVITKMYHTGDLARYNADGELEFLGRIDNQVKLRGFRIEMGEIENTASKYAGIGTVAAQVKTINGIQHLCLYYTSSETIDQESLKSHMAATLTEYMVPDIYMQLDEMPLTPNGKVNRKALPQPQLSSDVEYVEPLPGAETIIADTFAQVLGLKEPVGALDSFYALGGDSIKAIRLVSLLRQHDIVLQVAQVMTLKTVRAMAEEASGGSAVMEIDQQPWEGEVANSAIIDFFNALQLPNPNVFLQSQLLESKSEINMEALRQTFDKLVEHHDMLRAQMANDHLTVRPSTAKDLYSLTEYDLKNISDDTTLSEQVTQCCLKEKNAFDIVHGNMMRIAVIHTMNKDLLLIAIHHLVVDGVSWRILFEDIANLYTNYSAQQDVKLPLKTHSYLAYSEALGRYRESYALLQQADYWKEVQRSFKRLPLSKGNDYARTFGHTAVLLDSATTDGLLHKASEAYHTEINDLLLTALGRSYKEMTGETSLSLQLEGHGREDFGQNIMIDRTVGWFTSAYPVVLNNLGTDLRLDIRQTKEKLHQIPAKGFGYSQLKGMDVAEEPLMGFNYLGEVDAEQNSDSLFQMSSYDSGYDIAPENTFGTSISVNCSVAGGQLSCRFTYDEKQFSAEQMKRLAEGMVAQLQAVVNHCVGISTPELTASDLGSVTMTDAEFLEVQKHMAANGVTLQRIYPLTPMQEGMLLEYVSNPEATSYLSKSAFSLDKLVTEEQMREAIRLTAAKHEVMRTAILYKNIALAQQAITDRQPELKCFDITDSKVSTEEAVNKILADEIQHGIDLQDESLYKFLLIKTGDDSCSVGMVTQHIITDGWSAGLVNKDFFTNLIEICCGQQPIETTDGKGRYESFVRHLYQLDKKTGLNYWKNLLQGYGQQAIIPSRGEVPAEERAKDTDITLTMDPVRAARLNNVCQQEQVTLNSAIELAWGRTMQIYNNVEDVVFGKVVSGRDNAAEDVSDLAGIFINTVPVRVSTNADMTVREALHAIQNQAAETNKYDFCHLSEIQQQSELGSNLLKIILAFENFPGTDDKDQNANVPIHVEATDFKEENFADFEVVVHVGKEGELAMRIAFNPARYRSDEVEQVIRTFMVIADSIIDGIDGKMGDLQMVDSQERDELTLLGKGEPLQFDRQLTLVDIFRRQAAETPNATAIVFREKRLTYAEVDALTDRLAVKLHSLGIDREVAVGVMIDRSELMLIYPLAVMKAGGAYMPLDSHFPEDRLSFMCEDAGVELILSDDGIVKEAMPSYQGKIFQRSDLASLPEVTADDVAALHKPLAENMFVILYTSGSTGKPKGCMLEQRNIVNFCHWYVNEFNVTAEDRAVAYANFGFDAHMMDMYPALSVGASVYIIPSDMRMDLMAMNSYLEKEQLTIAFMTTQIGYMFATSIENHSLRLLSVGGEKLQPLKKPHFRFYNGYGPTECTLYSTFYNIDKDYDSSYIGRPLAGYQLYIVDKQMQLVPRGVPGELVVLGEGVGRGYLNRPDINAEKFITAGKLAGGNLPMNPDTRAYRTGDLVRWSPDGNIDFMGRIDNQVKLRGLRIELGEIEARASKFEGIKEVCVDVKDIGGMQNLVCYYSPVEGRQVEEEDLKSWLRETLTDFMVPEIYVAMEKLPLTPNGKINRRALPIPEINVSQGEIVTPETEMEKKLFEIISSMLKTDQFGVTTNLISVGMTSLSAMRLSATIQQQLGFEIKTKELLSTPTIRDLAALADNGSLKKTGSMRLGGPKVQTPNNPLQKKSESNPLQKRTGSNPLQKRNETDGQEPNKNNPLFKK
jgi:amino acid adenylation domain-containing protein/non-ribosomal peptide synthase protein (TIGR01720 family)